MSTKQTDKDESETIELLRIISDHENRVVNENFRDGYWESCANRAFRDGNLAACRELRQKLLKRLHNTKECLHVN